jgi:DNA-binding response OmpR family regulator
MSKDRNRHSTRVGQPSHQGTRLLVVDDHPDTVLTLARMLEMCGFEVMTACDGGAALEIAMKFRPRFVLLDIGLPSLDGYEVARRLRAETGLESTTLIAITGYGDEEARRLSREAGFDSHLVKPVNPAVLLATISRPEDQSC